MSGHSKWSTIKRKKAVNDARRGNVFTRLAREIALAARTGGGDLDTNFTLRLAMERAKAANMPKENIERAVKRGTGEDKDGAVFEQIMYEGYAPHGVALMIEVVTDNRNRTVSDLRHLLSKAGGNLAEGGAVAWQFKRLAYFAFTPEGLDEDHVFELAVEAGAEDVTFGDDAVEIYAPVDEFKNVNDALAESDIRSDEAMLRFIPSTTLQISPEHTVRVMRLIEALEELDDTQNVYSNLEITDEAVAILEVA